MTKTDAETRWRLYEELERFTLEDVDKIGIAPAGRFEDAPVGTKPTDLMPQCKSVVVFAIKHLDIFSTTRNLVCQALSQDITNQETSRQSYRISRFLEKHGFLAFPMFASVSAWPLVEEETGVAGRISLRHAAQLAGIGRIGRNAMLITPEFGPRVQLGAILTDADLPGSELLDENPCTACDLCLEICPAGALSAPTPPAEYVPVDREKCMAWRREHGGKSPLGYPNSCALCRAVCPVGRIRR